MQKPDDWLLHKPEHTSQYSGFTLRSNILYAVYEKLMPFFSIKMYSRTKHTLPMYGIRNILTDRKSTVVLLAV